MNLVISSVTMVDLTSKEAKKVSFSPGKNLLTSEHNHLGKSVIMKSIYYTLGAEVYYPHPIKKLNLLTFIDFSLNEHQYRVSRLKNSFTLYRDGVFSGLFSSVNAFEDELCKLFNFEINLVGKDQARTIVKCPPSFYYMPYYVDQENGWATNSFSFAQMTQFDILQRKNSFFFHLGALDNSYVEISKRQKANDRQITFLTKENEKYLTVIETLQEGLDDTQMSFDTASLEQAISLRQKEIKRLLDKISEIRTDLVEAEDQLVQLTHDKEILSKYIKQKKSKTESVDSELIECPRCGMVFERTLTEKLEKAYLLESLHDDYTTISERQVLLERRISKLKKSFESKQRILADYEKSLVTDRESYNAYVKSKATNQLLHEYHEQIGDNVTEIERLRKDNTEIRKQLEVYVLEKSQANTSYLVNLNKLFVGLDVPPDQIADNSEPGSSLVASGAYGPRCKIAQILAFIETQHAIAPEMITFPLVIDSPNVLEQDSEHLDSVIRTLFTWDKTDNQIIVASIEGKETACKISDVNIIILSNPQNHLFSTDEYIMYEKDIAEIFTDF
ncbi:MAG: hypothetical protein VB078_10855 [Clostridiaceae bacterium]|nr:hypothetical protein [Clostridiaceae bacterium]